MNDALELMREVARYVWVRRQWAVGLFVVFLVLLGVLVTMAGSPALVPFVYPMF